MVTALKMAEIFTPPASRCRLLGQHGGDRNLRIKATEISLSFPMLLIRTLPFSSSSNQLRQLLFAAPRFPGERSFRLLKFQRMDSFGCSANSHALPDSPCYGSSGGGDEEHSHNRYHISDVVMVGKIPLYLKRKKRLSMDISSRNSQVTNNLPPFEPFDICPFERRGNAKPGATWQVKGRDTVKVMEHVAEATNGRVLRPGMVLLKHYITLREQVNIVKTCQKLGLGPGGFYRPGYKDGAKLRLQMMCLGLDWDPQTRKYENNRAVDGDKPPDIPPEFAILVRKALKDARALIKIKNQCNTSNVEGILPFMSPDICIVNFYTTSGRLGLHQDRDESKDSLISGLPVVSFSVGNSAEFLYGDQRDVDKAEKVVLESGDVLIFGGESRHIFHGVSSIIPKSTPKFLLDHTGLRPGRLNLTFRKY